MLHRSMLAKYLLRFDDICPTMNWQIWEQVDAVLKRENVMPILAVVPDNLDPKLHAAPARAEFWQRLRTYQQLGWAIGLHGYQHQYVNKSAGLVGIHAGSEFAGLLQLGLQCRNCRYRLTTDTDDEVARHKAKIGGNRTGSDRGNNNPLLVIERQFVRQRG